MHLLGELKLFLPGQVLLRSPSIWEAIQRVLGLPVDLSTGEQSTERDALTLVELLEAAMKDAGVTSATWLAMDEQILFHDRKREPDDLGLFDQIVHQEAPRLAGQFQGLTVVFEHQGDDVETLIEATISPHFRGGEPALRLTLGGRVSSLRRSRAEGYEDAKTRLRSLLAQSQFLASHRAAFRALQTRLAGALERHFGPGARVEAPEPRVVLIRPSPHYLQALAEISLRGALMWARPTPFVGPAAPPVIDPWDRYYHDLTYAWVDLIELDEQVFPHGEIRVASPLPILDTRGHDLTAVEDESALRQRLYSAHLAAMHDFNEPDRRAVELRGYEKAEGA